MPDLLPDVVILLCFIASADRQGSVAKAAARPSPLRAVLLAPELLPREGSLMETLLPESVRTSNFSGNFSDRPLDLEAEEESLRLSV